MRKWPRACKETPHYRSRPYCEKGRIAVLKPSRGHAQDQKHIATQRRFKSDQAVIQREHVSSGRDAESTHTYTPIKKPLSINHIVSTRASVDTPKKFTHQFSVTYTDLSYTLTHYHTHIHQRQIFISTLTIKCFMI